MTARNGSGEWHGSVESGSGAVTVGDAAHEWWTLVAVCVGTFMLLLDVTIVNVALPKIQAGLGSSFTDLQWVSGAVMDDHVRVTGFDDVGWRTTERPKVVEVGPAGCGRAFRPCPFRRSSRAAGRHPRAGTPL